MRGIPGIRRADLARREYQNTLKRTRESWSAPTAFSGPTSSSATQLRRAWCLLTSNARSGLGNRRNILPRPFPHNFPPYPRADTPCFPQVAHTRRPQLINSLGSRTRVPAENSSRRKRRILPQKTEQVPTTPHGQFRKRNKFHIPERPQRLPRIRLERTSRARSRNTHLSQLPVPRQLKISPPMLSLGGPGATGRPRSGAF